MNHAADATQEIDLTDVTEWVLPRAPASSAEELSVSDLEDLSESRFLEAREAREACEARVDAEDLVATRAMRAQRHSTDEAHAKGATLRVPTLTLAQANSALATPAALFSDAPVSPALGTTRAASRLPYLARLRAPRLSTPAWAALSAAAAALIATTATFAMAPMSRHDDASSTEAKNAERVAASAVASAATHGFKRAEALGRWSELPTFVADVSVDSLPLRAGRSARHRSRN